MPQAKPLDFLPVSIADNDVAHVLLSPLNASFLECAGGRGGHVVDVSLTSEPSADVHIELSLTPVSGLPCNIRRAGGQSLVIGGPSLVILRRKGV